MTNLEVIKHLIGSNASPTDERLTIAAQLKGIDPAAEYDESIKCKIYGLAISEIGQDGQKVKAFSESDLSYTYADTSSSSIAQLALDSECPDLIAQYGPAQPKKAVIRNASNKW